jgi:hypothetical protein
MKRSITLMLLLLALLLLSAGAGALSNVGCQVVAATISGGGYQLTSFEAQPSNVATGGAYRLLGPAVPELRGSGCCCTYLPCTLRNQ